jgi:diguanylate cyclase (GGDEF)-like protein
VSSGGLSVLAHRLRWRRDEVVASLHAVESAVIARAYAYFFGLGALLVALVPVLPGLQFDRPVVVTAAVALAALTSLGSLVVYEDIPPAALRILPALGTVLISAVIAGSVPAAAPAFFLMYLWVVLTACSFFGLRVGLVHVAAIAALSGAAFLLRDVPQGAVLWSVGVAAFCVTGLMLSLLRERADTLILQLDAAANVDALTGLPNRRSFEARLGDELYRADRSGQPLCLLAIDVDHFKQINDREGHGAGDRMLKRVAEVLAANRRLDLSARIGGDEFVLLLPGADRSGGREVAERVRLSVAGLEGFPAPSISLGIAAFPDDGGDAEDLHRAADCALYHAKEHGRNAAVLFAPEMLRHVRA